MGAHFTLQRKGNNDKAVKALSGFQSLPSSPIQDGLRTPCSSAQRAARARFREAFPTRESAAGCKQGRETRRPHAQKISDEPGDSTGRSKQRNALPLAMPYGDHAVHDHGQQHQHPTKSVPTGSARHANETHGYT